MNAVPVGPSEVTRPSEVIEIRLESLTVNLAWTGIPWPLVSTAAAPICTVPNCGRNVSLGVTRNPTAITISVDVGLLQAAPIAAASVTRKTTTAR